MAFDYKVIRARLEEVMKENDDGYNSLARKIGTSPSTVCRWFQKDIGSINNKALVKIADLYNINVAWLLGMPHEPKEKEELSHREKRNEIFERTASLTNKQLDQLMAVMDAMFSK